MLGVTVAWTEAVQGRGDLDETTCALMHLFNADAVLLVRGDPKSRMFRRVLLNQREGNALYRNTVGEVLSGRILGNYLGSAQPGSVWRLSESRTYDDAPDHGAASGVPEAITIVVGRANGFLDCLELQFCRETGARTEDLVSHLAQVFSDTWSRRAMGVMQSLILAAVPKEVGEAPRPVAMPIMDVSNPAGLSRSEFRICTLVGQGMAPKAIAQQLALRETTVRTHLSAIYSKTATAGIVDLVHRLNAGDQRTGRAI